MIGQGLTLVTGATGSGKTAWVVDELSRIGDRPLFVMGVPGLRVPHETCPPVSEWVELRPDPDDPSLLMPYFRFPAGSLVVLDEAQRVFRPRPSGSKVPPEVAAFETRRHLGVDFVLITQHQSLLDMNVRRLVTRHLHVHVTFFGRALLEWVGLGEPDEKGSRELASRVKYALPKEAFSLYKSAEVHTKVVRRLPWQVYAVGIAVPVMVGFGWFVWNRMVGHVEGEKPAVAEVVKPASVGPSGVQTGVQTARDYMVSRQPRIAGLAHTAPVYDELARPVEVPYPVGCIQSAERGCRCYDQRGGLYETTGSICQQVLQGRMFVDFVRQDIEERGPRQREAVVVADARGVQPVPGVAVVGRESGVAVAPVGAAREARP